MTTAGQLAKQGATVVIGGRRLPHATGVAAELSEGAPGTVEALQLELDDIASINRFATAVAAKFPGGVHALINNAGVMNTPLRAKSRDEGGGKAVARTRDGFEMQLGVNHLGHFALTQARARVESVRFDRAPEEARANPSRLRGSHSFHLTISRRAPRSR
jgi:NAD(P)-dependent dehydrogenase (short-subunit alcohol dehydrogenase family)